MAKTFFSGPVQSENGFESVTKNATTGAVTVSATLGAATSVDSVTVADFVALTPIATSELPAAAAGNEGQVRLINDNGAGDDEYCLVISTGAAWVTAVGAALS